MKKGKSVANGTFFSKIIPLPCPFSCFWRMGHFYLQHLWIDGGDGWKSASERPIWSAFNGLEWKAGEGDRTFSSSLCRECYFWNFLSGIIHRAFFFFFIFCVYCTWIVSVGLRGCPGHHCSLSQLELFDIFQKKWTILAVRYKQWISDRLGVGFFGGEGEEGSRWLCREGLF